LDGIDYLGLAAVAVVTQSLRLLFRIKMNVYTSFLSSNVVEHPRKHLQPSFAITEFRIILLDISPNFAM